MKKRKKNRDKAKKFPFPYIRKPQGDQERKLSEIIKEMAHLLLKNPSIPPTEPASAAVLLLAGAAWNIAVGDENLPDNHCKVIEQIDWGNVKPWEELRSNDTDWLIAELVEYKQKRFPDDLRLIMGSEMTPQGNFRVHWVYPDEIQNKLVAPRFGAPAAKPNNSKAAKGRPIAEKILKKMKKHAGSKVVDFKAAIAGRVNAEELQKTVVSREALARLHPAHAAYVYAQNQVSAMSEQLTALKEMDQFAKIISKAENMYMPSGPPMSPLTSSFFTCWAFFDVCAGPAEETIGTAVMSVGAAFGMDDEVLRLIGLMQESRMGIYLHEGTNNGDVTLRELVTNTVCRAIVPAGYRGRKGELWYARVLPPPFPDGEEHVVFTTPYLLINPGQRDWQAYFRRTLPVPPHQELIKSYERHMKFGPTHDYWTEFVFEAYVNHRTEVIFLQGLPDIPESRPHSRINSQ